MTQHKSYQKTLLILILLLAINYISSFYFHRFDITKDKRYTLSDETISLVESIKKPVNIKVYLQGDFPAEFKRIQLETTQFLDELNAINDLVKFRFIDPMSGSKDLISKGLQPSRLTVQEDEM
jgi:ABC-2 type transport system permease protein